MFGTDLHAIDCNTTLAVFTREDNFCGLIQKGSKEDGGRLKYQFVLNTSS